MRWDKDTKTVNKLIGEAIAVAIAGMLNSKGGTLLIGVADDGTVVGIEHDLQDASQVQSRWFSVGAYRYREDIFGDGANVPT